MHATLLVWFLTAATPAAPDTVVVCPTQFSAALQPWLDFRREQGRVIEVLPGGNSAEKIRSAIRTAAAGGRLRHVLLIGDVDVTPTHLAKAEVNIHWGSEPQIATDNWFADLDDDHVPDVAIGRITADSAAELEIVIKKILQYEAEASRGLWRRQINFVAGVGGFGTIADAVLEMATKKFLTDGIPACYNTSMTYGSWQSPFCPDPRSFHQATLDRLNEGCLFWVYIGHGNRHYLDRVRTPAGTFHILDVKDASKVKSAQGHPIAIFLACYTGAFDHPRDCLAEEILRQPQGPAAVVCGSRVTMPYAMAVLSNGMMAEFFDGRRETLGEVLLHAKRRLMTVDPEDENRQLLDAIAKAISPLPEKMAEERAEHLHLFNLIGDPLLRLYHPPTIQVETESSIRAGQRLAVSLTSEIAGEGRIELVCRRDRHKATIPMRATFYATDGFLASFNSTYEKANDRIWLSERISLRSGMNQCQLDVPADVRGFCQVRVFAKSEQDLALGAAKVFVRRPE